MAEPTRLTPAPPAREAAPRRAFVRYPASPALSCPSVSSGTYKFRWAEVLDVSRGGVGLLLGRSLDDGSPVTILLQSRTTDQLYELQARVANCARQADGSWKVGCEFLTRLGEEQLRALL